MKLLPASVFALLLPAVSARFFEAHEYDHLDVDPRSTAEEKFLIEVGPGKTLWVTEEQKWELRRKGQRFMDITETPDLGSLSARSLADTDSVVFPAKVTLQDEVNPLLTNLSKSHMKSNLEKLTSFHTRYYKSDWGRQSSEWVLKQVQNIIEDAGADEYNVTAKAFPHTWQQASVIARIPGKTNSTVVIGAHQDSINLFLPSVLSAPGADDDGSGTVTILEAFRILLSSEDVIKGKLENTLEFHWYSAEEGGLLGSQAIFSSYEKAKRDVKAMLQQDMTGYASGTVEAGKVESVGVIVDFVNEKLTDFIKKIIVEYCAIPFVETKCGYACSDHASASKAGYPSAFVIESAFEDSDPHIHTVDDSISYLSFDHMLQHARLTLAFAYELGFTNFAELKHETVEPEMGDL